MPTASPATSPTLLEALIRESPFLRLTAHFVQSIFRSGQDDGDIDAGIGGLLGLLALPGVFVTLSLLDKYSSLMRYFRGTPISDHYVISLPDKYFFIGFSMVITGLVTVWKWDRILPSRQDHVNLAPLPISMTRIFFANLLAVLAVIALFAVVVNAVSILFPLIVTAEYRILGQALAFMATHALVVMTASAFTFFCCVFVLGALMAVFPPALFQRIAIPVRMLIVSVLVALLGTSFAIPALLRKAPAGSLLHALPPVWFLGWYQSLQDRASPLMDDLGRLGWQATLVAAAAAMLAYLVSYRRYFLRIPESQGLVRSGTRERWPLIRRVLERLLFRTPFERATGIFALRALSRSEAHLITYTGFAAMGLVAASQAAVGAFAVPFTATPSRAWLSIPLMAAYFLVAGTRFVLEMPAGVEANWIFRTILAPGPHGAIMVARKLILMLVLVAVVLPSALAFSWFWGPAIGITHALVVLVLAWVLAELLLIGFRKIPFTCSLPPFQRHAPLMILLAFVGFAVFSWVGAAAARAMLLAPARFGWLAAFLAASLYAVRQWNAEIPDVDREVIFHDPGTRAFERLELTS